MPHVKERLPRKQFGTTHFACIDNSKPRRTVERNGRAVRQRHGRALPCTGGEHPCRNLFGGRFADKRGGAHEQHGNGDRRRCDCGYGGSPSASE
jgi:hypothetical protein